MQLLCKLPLRALEFTDVGGHKKTPAQQHSLTWLETLLPFGHHRADASSLLEIRYIHLTQPDKLYKHPNVNKADFITLRKAAMWLQIPIWLVPQ